MSNQKRQQEVDSSDIDLVQNCSAVDILEAKMGQVIRSLTILKKNKCESLVQVFIKDTWFGLVISY